MSIVKAFVCDIGGETCARDELMRLGVRTMDDRPEDADNVDVCVQHARLAPVAQVLAIAAKMRAGGD
jgi:hypothetical protein